jgi:hypothetical protein
VWGVNCKSYNITEQLVQQQSHVYDGRGKTNEGSDSENSPLPTRYIKGGQKGAIWYSDWAKD